MDLYCLSWITKNGQKGNGDYIFSYQDGLAMVESLNDHKNFPHDNRDYRYYLTAKNDLDRSIERSLIIKGELQQKAWDIKK